MNLRQTVSLFVTAIILRLVLGSVLVNGSIGSDRDALLALKSKISNDPLGILMSWNESVDTCNWSGVTCGRRHRRVTELDLGSQQLEGSLSPHIGNLSFLKSLILENNNFSLEIPQELGALSRLQNLVLENNSFSGEIPVNLSRCSNLVFLILRGNELGGELPSELGVLSKLQVLEVGNNNFVGTIPPSLGNLSSLERIRATYNNLHGSIPSTLGQLNFLKFLIFGENNLSGPIPSVVFNLSSLTTLSFPVNQLNGSLPTDIGVTLPKLEALRLFDNQFIGPIPATIANLTNLAVFLISSNGFTGKAPYFRSLRDLRTIGMDENDLGNGENDDLDFMSSLLNCTSVETFVLSDNKFGGTMPEFLSNFSTKMRKLGFGRNQIQGRVPSEIGNLINLVALGMETNLLTGTIPRSVGKLKFLNDFYLNGNKLSGQIPSSIGNLTTLGRVNLRLNNLQGSIPSSIGRCVRLLSMFISWNNLSGTIPKELLSISSLSTFLDLSENTFTGSLPIEVGKLVSLNYLDVSGNNLSGEIPETLRSCISLEVLYLDDNLFHGKIPSSLNSLKGLQYLDLSRNNLSGQVPSYLETFALFNLNLSFNNFEGELPDQGVFSNLTAISVTGNKRLCGGIPKLNLPSCHSEKSKLRLIVSLISGIVGMIIVSFLIFLYISRKNRQLPTTSGSLITTSILKVSYDDLLKATDGFSSSNLIGVGGFGSVYKGILGQERLIVAIKVLNLAKKGATRSFMAECEALQSLRHRNLVRIITACSSVDFKGNDFKALVYEFMINGSLEDWLHAVHTDESYAQKYLTFVQRFNIILDVANALHYMHNEGQIPIVHCDLKPSNILIDEDMMARVGDFGLARLSPGSTHQFSSTQSSSIGIKGSIGYAAPEYGMGSEVSTYGDVYSFGILLLETFTGKRPTNSMFEDGLDLHNFAKMNLPERVMQIVDPVLFHSDDLLRKDQVLDCLISIVKLGVACSVESPRERINIRKVVEELVHIKDNLLQTKVDLTVKSPRP